MKGDRTPFVYLEIQDGNPYMVRWSNSTVHYTNRGYRGWVPIFESRFLCHFLWICLKDILRGWLLLKAILAVYSLNSQVSSNIWKTNILKGVSSQKWKRSLEKITYLFGAAYSSSLKYRTCKWRQVFEHWCKAWSQQLVLQQSTWKTDSNPGYVC